MKLMQHPQHGWHYATPNEEASMRAHGWVDAVQTVAAPQDDGSVPSLSSVDPVGAAPAANVQPIKRGPGRPRKAA
jgi:hypothetical protein